MTAFGCGEVLAAAVDGAKIEPTYIDSLRNYNYDQGLPQASVNAIVQGHDGYLWLATFGGLVRFNGKDFKIFHADTSANAPKRHNLGTAKGPASERITKLLEDRRRRLWIGSEDAGIGYRLDGQFRQLIDVCGGKCQIDALAEEGDGDLLVLGSGRLYEVNTDTLSYRVISAGNASYSFLAATRDGSIYVGGQSGMAHIVASTVQPIALPANIRSVRTMTALGNNMWFVSDDLSLYRFEAATGNIALVRRSLATDTHLLTANNAKTYISDSRNGMRVLADNGEETVLASTATQFGVAVLDDDEGNTWIGTPTQGLWRLRKSRIGLMAAADTRMEGPGRALSGDGHGGIWFGMACDDLRHWDASENLHSVALRPMLHSECPQSLRLSQRGDLWIGSFEALGRIVAGQLQSAGAWPQEDALNVWQARDGAWYVASTAHTWKLDVDADDAVRGRHVVAALDGAAIAYMTDSRKGGAWFVGNRGAWRMQDERIVERWTSGNDGIRGAQFRALYEGDDGTLWIGTYGSGLIRIRNGVVRQFDESSGLSDNTVSCILADDFGRLWLGGNQGLSVLQNARGFNDDEEPRISMLAATEGMLPPEMNGGAVSACLRDEKGRLWFSMIRGFAMADPRDFADLAPHTPIANIERVQVDGHALDTIAPLVLGAKVSNLEISYSGISFSHPDLLRYRYRLSRADREWVETGSNRTVLIPTIPWGTFSFEVEAKVLGGAWSPAASVHFNHPLPWYRYQSIWLIVSALALLCLLWMTREKYTPLDYSHVLKSSRRTGL